MMDPQQEYFDTFGSWMITRLLRDMAQDQAQLKSPLRAFLAQFYEDMLANPGDYAIPAELFKNFFARVTLTPDETAQHEALKAARMRVRKVVFSYLEFLFELGKSGDTVEATGNLQIPSGEFDRLMSTAVKKSKNRNFLNVFERNGLSFVLGESVDVSNLIYPGMPAALVRFSQACGRVKEFDFYLFRRCDFAVFEGKTGPTIMDALNLVPMPFQARVAETDTRLLQMKFKREIFVDGGDMTYRLRYSRKSDQVVYWVRILETFHPDLGHYLRWKLDSDLTERLFLYLEGISPGLSDRVYDGLKPCAHCYPGNCMDRVIVKKNGSSKEACKGEGWNRIGFSQADYEALWIVLGTLNHLVTTNE
jgi:hypothetical protein